MNLLYGFQSYFYKNMFCVNFADTESLDHHLKDIILGKREALSYLHKRRAVYGTQGITCECCYNSCTYSELAEYCNWQESDSQETRSKTLFFS